MSGQQCSSPATASDRRRASSALEAMCWSARAIVVGLLLCGGVVRANAQAVREDFDVTNGLVQATAVQGNTLYIAGSFTRVGRPSGAGVPIDATTGTPVRGFPHVDGQVNCVVSDGAGGWYIGGRFRSVGGAPRNNIAHILADDTVSPWNPNATNVDNPAQASVAALAVGGGAVYAGGSFTSIAGQPRACVAALDAITGNATDWIPDGNASRLTGVTAIAVSGTNVCIGGGFSPVGELPKTFFGAVDATTGHVLPWAYDFGYGGGGNGVIHALAAAGSVVYVGGLFTTYAGTPHQCLMAIDPATGIPTAWDPEPNGEVRALVVNGGTVYAGGAFSFVGSQPRHSAAAFDTATGLMTGWDPAPSNQVWSLAASGNTIYLGGDFEEVGGLPRSHIAAVDATRGTATAWNPNIGGGRTRVLALAANATTVYAGGRFDLVGGHQRNHLAAIDLTTGRTTAWNPNADGPVTVLVASGDWIYVAGGIGGGFFHVGGQARSGVAALDARSGRATSWDPNPISREGYVPSVLGMAATAKSIYIGGVFSDIGGQPRSNIAAVDRVTGRATSWSPNTDSLPGRYSYVVDVVAGDGAIFASGNGFTYSLDARTAATRWTHDDTSGLPWGRVLQLARGVLYLGTGGSLVALDAASGSATPWHVGIGGDVRAVAVRGNVVYAAGDFTSWEGQPRASLIAFDRTTGAILDWAPNPGVVVNTLAFAGPSLVLGGVFDFIGQTLATAFPGGGFFFGGGSARSNLALVEAINAPPDCSHATAVPATIEARGSRWVPVRIGGVTDPDGNPAAIRVTRVTQDEPVVGDTHDRDHEGGHSGLGESSAGQPSSENMPGHGGPREPGRACGDASIDRDGDEVAVRAERSSRGNGRVYTIWFTATDESGASCDGSVQVCVPLDREHPNCVDDGQKYNSVGPCPPRGRDHDHRGLSLAVQQDGVSASPSATMEYSLPEEAEVSVAVYDVAGRRVAMLQHGPQSAGTHSVTWNSKGAARGMYFCRLVAGGETVTKSVLVLR